MVCFIGAAEKGKSCGGFIEEHKGPGFSNKYPAISTAAA